jgi:hypothetical protein
VRCLGERVLSGEANKLSDHFVIERFLPGGRVFLRSIPPTPSRVNRSCQRHTTDLLRPAAAHYRVRVQSVGRQQNDTGRRTLLLRAVAVRHRRFGTSTVSGRHFDADLLAHPPDLHDAARRESSTGPIR